MNKFEDIIPPSRRKKMDMTDPAPTPQGGEQTAYTRPPRSRFPFQTLGIVLVIIAVSVGLLFYFSSAKVEVVPETAPAVVQGSFTATQGSGNLPFLVITSKKIATQTLPGSGTKTVNTAASGKITLYNTSSSVQHFVANTRFETPSGLIFTTHNAITIPKGTPTSPGQVTDTVYAAQSGASYNVDPTSFTVPGLAGTPLATEVYARSVIAMSGGASGTIPVVDASSESQALTQLVQALGPQLTTDISGQIPEGYILVPGSATTTYTELTPTPSATTGMVDIREQGTMTAVVFPNAALAEAAAATVTGLNYQNEPMTFASTTGLTFLSSDPIPGADTQNYSFTLSGTATFIYTVDPSRIAAAVAGKTRSSAEVALTNYPEVKSAVLILRPFWKQTFPEDPSSVTVLVDKP